MLVGDTQESLSGDDAANDEGQRILGERGDAGIDGRDDDSVNVAGELPRSDHHRRGVINRWPITLWHAGQVTKRRRRVRPPIPGGAPHSARSSLDWRACTTSMGVGSSRGGGAGSKRRGRTIGHTEHLISFDQEC